MLEMLKNQRGTPMTTAGAEAYFLVDTIMCDSCRGNIKAQLSRIVGVIAIDYPFVDDDKITNGGQYLRLTYNPQTDINPANIAKQICSIQGPYWEQDNQCHRAELVEKPSPRVRFGY